jgi:hypothetical protein
LYFFQHIFLSLISITKCHSGTELYTFIFFSFFFNFQLCEKIFRWKILFTARYWTVLDATYDFEPLLKRIELFTAAIARNWTNFKIKIDLMEIFYLVFYSSLFYTFLYYQTPFRLKISWPLNQFCDVNK